MSMATKADAQPPALPAADSHDLIRVHGARVNNLKDTTAAGSSSRAHPPTSPPPAPPSPASTSRPTPAPDRKETGTCREDGAMADQQLPRESTADTVSDSADVGRPLGQDQSEKPGGSAS